MTADYTFGSAPTSAGSPLLPPLVEAPPAAADYGPAPSAPRGQIMTIGLIAALLVTVIALGWGFTQWSSASSWKKRSQHTEGQFNSLEKRVGKAEAARSTAEHAALANRRGIVSTENRLAKLANEKAFLEDVRVQFCE